MKTFVYHENASGINLFMKTGDAWAVDEVNKIFAVADPPLRCLIIDTKEYPFDDYGYECAGTFCKSFLKYSKEEITNSDFSENTLKDILLKCNEDIKKLNLSLGKKYNDKLNYDIAETVGVGILIKDNILYYGGVEDCYLNILRGNNLDNIAKWDYQIMKSSKYLNKISAQGKLDDYIPNELKGKLRDKHRWEPCWCNYLRNNINAVDEEGNLVGWGCFTGEDTVNTFIQTYSVELNKGDNILLFSDGMIPVLDNPDFLSWFLDNVNNSFYFQSQMREKIIKLFNDNSKEKEKTLIYFEY